MKCSARGVTNQPDGRTREAYDVKNPANVSRDNAKTAMATRNQHLLSEISREMGGWNPEGEGHHRNPGPTRCLGGEHEPGTQCVCGRCVSATKQAFF